MTRELSLVFRRSFLKAAAGAAAAPFLKSATNPPNIIFIYADDLGYGDLGCYGSSLKTPNLDALAKEGALFRQFYSASPVCSPSRAALLTGYYPQQVRRDTVPNLPSGNGGKRPGWARLLPEMLRPAGYRTYHSGKWHVDGQAVELGFDRSYDLTDQNRFFTPKSHTEDGKALPPVTSEQGYYATTAIADHALKCLREHQEKFADRPFFHYVCFTAPHFPLQAPANDIDRYRDRYHDGWELVREARWMRMKERGLFNQPLSQTERDLGPPYHYDDVLPKTGADEVNRPTPWNDLTATQKTFQATKMAIHAAMVDRMDREIGRLLEQLRTMKAWDDTLILFASDNGASAEMMIRGEGHDPNAAAGSEKTHLCLGPGWSTVANTPFRRHKTWVHEGGIATPLIAHWPGGIRTPGELRHQPTHLIDFLPTILEVTNVKALDTWNDQPVPPRPGKSLVPTFTRDGQIARDYLWWSHEQNRALRAGDWKIVVSKKGPWELYNLANDRAESKNLASEQPDRVREMERLWDQEFQSQLRWAKTDLPENKTPAK